MIEVDKVYGELDAYKRNMRTLRLSSLGKNPLSLHQTKKPPDGWLSLAERKGFEPLKPY